MAYTRKTRDYYELLINYGYGHGWESETCEDTREEIKARRQEYRENCPQYPTRIVKRREQIATGSWAADGSHLKAGDSV